MYIVLDEENNVVGLTSRDSIKRATTNEVVEIETTPDDVVENYKFIDGEFIQTAK